MKNYNYIILGAIALLAGFVVAVTNIPRSFLGVDEIKEWEKVDSPLKLKVEKDKILDVQEIDDFRCDEDLNCENLGKIKKYLYISDKKIEKTKLDYNGKQYDETRRTKNAIIYKVDPPKDLLGATEEKEYFVGKFYTGEPFYEDVATGDYYQTETATTTIEAYDAQTATTTAEMILSWLGVKEAIGACGTSGDPCYSSPSDVIYKQNSNNWDVTHDATAGSGIYGGTPEPALYCMWNGSVYALFRGIFLFDTSPIDDSATIVSSSLNLYIAQANYNADNISYGIVQSTPDSDTSIVVGDFDQVGTVNSPTEGATRIAISSMTAGAYSSFALNATGLGWVSKTGKTKLGIRASKDIDDVAPPGINGVVIRDTPYTGTSYDPYLTVTFTIGGVTVENPKQDVFWFN